MFSSSCVKKLEKCSEIGTSCVFASRRDDDVAAGCP